MQDFNNQVFQINVESLLSNKTKDLERWSELYKILVLNKNIIDRTQNIIMPYNTVLYEPFRMPEIDHSFNKSFKDICVERASEILELQKRSNKKIYLFYSGGIDSVLVLVSFMMVQPLSELKDKLYIVMTQESISEYMLMYQKFIRPNFKIIAADQISELFIDKNIIVTGSQGDKIFGTDHVSEINRLGMFDRVFDSVDNFVIDYWHHLGMRKELAAFWFDLIKDQTDKLDVSINSNFDFLWWFNFNFEWQSEYFLFFMRSFNNLKESYHKNNIHAFFDSHDFQKWSMVNPQNKIKKKWSSYKFPAKDLILEYTKDQDYYENKIKIVSAGRLFQNKRMPLGIDTNFNLINNIDRETLYNYENSLF